MLIVTVLLNDELTSHQRPNAWEEATGVTEARHNNNLGFINHEMNPESTNIIPIYLSFWYSTVLLLQYSNLNRLNLVVWDSECWPRGRDLWLQKYSRQCSLEPGVSLV